MCSCMIRGRVSKERWFLMITRLSTFFRPSFLLACLLVTALSVVLSAFLAPESAFVYESPIRSPASFLIHASNNPTDVAFGTDDRGTTEVYKSANHPGSLIESVVAHAPLCLAHGLFYAPAKHSLSCQDWSHNKSIERDICEDYLDRVRVSQVVSKPDKGFSFMDVRRIQSFPGSLNSKLNVQWHNGTVVFASIDPSDIGLDSVLMRLLLVFSVALRGNTAYGSFLGEISSVVLLLPGKMHPIFDLQLSGKYSFLGGLLDALFRKQGIEVFVTPSLPELLAPVRGNALDSYFPFAHLRKVWFPDFRDAIAGRIASRSNQSVCFLSAVHVGSFSNRFAFPDAYMPVRSPVRNDSSFASNIPLQFPLSSEALSLRRIIYSPQEPPSMRNKITYIAQGWQHSYTFTRGSELEFRALLQRVAANANAELSILEAGPRTLMDSSYEELLRYVHDSSVIIGLHGPGLAFSVFAPTNTSCLIEVIPQKIDLFLYENVRSFGLDYVRVGLSMNPVQWLRPRKLVLGQDDVRTIESTLTEKVFNGRAKVGGVG